MIRVQEQAIITILELTVNRDNVKFLTQWTPKNVVKPSEANIVVTTTDAITNVTRQVTNSPFKGRLANQLGIDYNTMIAHLNNDTTVWSPAFGLVVSIWEEGATMAMEMHDIKHDVWVTFKSKADTSRFIWRVANRSQAFDRYLADPKLLY